MHDLLIRGGRVVDGAGTPARTADIAIRQGKIVEIGHITSPAREVLDADGAVVTPGFVDPHTHFDGQLLWDDKLDPAFSHGVTTAIAGNCGVGFAPLRPEFRRQLVELMEGVEDVPGIVLDEGLDWDWRDFGDYLDRVGARSYTMDVASQLTHAPLRVAVMGERALRHEPATQDDLAQMMQVVREAMQAGAIGVSGGRLIEHMSSMGENVPGVFADDGELTALARAMGESGRGTFQIIPLGAIGDMAGTGVDREGRRAEVDRIARIAAASGRPVTYSLIQFASDPEDWRMMLAETEKHAARGLRIAPQVGGRPAGFLVTLDGHHPFRFRLSYREVAHLNVAQRAAALRDPRRRAAVLSEQDDEGLLAAAKPADQMIPAFFKQRAPHLFPVSASDLEPAPDARVDARAQKAGVTPEVYVYDYLTAGEGDQVLADMQLGYCQGSFDATREMLAHPLTISGLGDGGAHLAMVCDASQTTGQLTLWTRDRTRGARLPLELMVSKLTKCVADLYGLDDRGAIEVGRRADINVIDFGRLNLDLPRIVHDLPAGGARLLQDSHGYVATLVEGTFTRRDDKDTGARPGRLIRAGH